MTPEEFKAEIRTLADKIGVSPREIHLRKMNKKLASCSSKGRLTFDPSLLDESNEKIIEAIIHELLHLRYPNHGRMFKVLLNTYMLRAGNMSFK
jgi:predicted metal-dependent hydrolase